MQCRPVDYTQIFIVSNSKDLCKQNFVVVSSTRLPFHNEFEHRTARLESYAEASILPVKMMRRRQFDSLILIVRSKIFDFLITLKLPVTRSK